MSRPQRRISVPNCVDVAPHVTELNRREERAVGSCKRIAQQMALAFGIEIDKDVVRRILGIHFRPEAGSGGPSWLSFIGHTKDSLWSLDLFRCESAMLLRTYWVLRIQASRGEIAKSLEGNWRPELIFVLQQELEMYDTYQRRVAECDIGEISLASPSSAIGLRLRQMQRS